MSTRRVTRSTTGALTERDKNVPVAALSDAHTASAKAVMNSGPAKKRTASAKAESAPKRNKAASSVPTASIPKRGWTLPHGMGGGELIVDDAGTMPGNAAAASSSTTSDQTTAEEAVKSSQAGEDKDIPVPSDEEALPANVARKIAAAEKKLIGPQRRPPRLATRNVKYNEDLLESDDTDGAATAITADSPVAATDKTGVAVRHARRAVEKVKLEEADDIDESMTNVPDGDGDPGFKTRIKRGTTNKYGLTRGYSPYPYRTVPTPEQCDEVHRILVETHGAVIQPAKAPPPSITVAGCGEVRSVLDALLRTRISANTLMPNSDRAIAQLAETYGVATYGVGTGSIDWNAVRLGSLEKLTTAIRVAGTPKLKAGHIKTILDMVYEEQKARAQAHIKGVPVPGAQNEDDGQKALEVMKAADDYLSLEHMRAMTADEAINEFVKYPGIAVKTAACVVLFCLRIPCFAVDTHVHKMCKWLGWVPEKANETDTFNHGEHMIPDHLKYAFHQLFIRHGQDCFKCRKNTKPGTKAWQNAPPCPLEHLLDRNKSMAKGGEEDDDDEDDEEELVDADSSLDTEKKTKQGKGKKKASKAEPEGGVVADSDFSAEAGLVAKSVTTETEEKDKETKSRKRPRTRKAGGRAVTQKAETVLEDGTDRTASSNSATARANQTDTFGNEPEAAIEGPGASLTQGMTTQSLEEIALGVQDDSSEDDKGDRPVVEQPVTGRTLRPRRAI